MRLLRRDERLLVTMRRGGPFATAAALLALATGATVGPARADAPTAKPNSDLAFTCLQQHTPIETGDAIAYSVDAGATSWGACITKAGMDYYETWWKGKGKSWTVLGKHLKTGSTTSQVTAQGYGIPKTDVDALVQALSKAHFQKAP